MVAVRCASDSLRFDGLFVFDGERFVLVGVRVPMAELVRMLIGVLGEIDADHQPDIVGRQDHILVRVVRAKEGSEYRVVVTVGCV